MQGVESYLMCLFLEILLFNAFDFDILVVEISLLRINILKIALPLEFKHGSFASNRGIVSALDHTFK